MKAAGFAPLGLVVRLRRAPAHALVLGMSLRSRLVLFTLLWLLILTGGASASTPAVPITSCTNITQPGYYYLESDIINASTDAYCINIFASDVVLDGRGHVIEGTEGAGGGLYAYNVSRVRIKNLSIRGFVNGIIFDRVSSSLIESSTISGIRMYGAGIVLAFSSGNTLSGNNISGNPWGVVLGASSGNSISDNIISGNTQWGVWLAEGSSNNVLSGNIISGNWGGVLLSPNYPSSNNTISGNIISGNRVGALIDSNNSLIYNNLFNNTQNVQFAFSSPYYSNAWNTTKQAGTNIVGGPYIGGNYWGSPSGDGYSDTCSDSDGDGICDSPYVLSNETASEIDYLPLTRPVGMPEFQGYAALTALVPWVGYLLRRRAG